MSRPETGRALDAPAPLFAALGDRTRLNLVSRLVEGRALSIAQLASGLTLTRQGVTKHLRVLERAGLVSSSRVGREHQYSIVPESIDQARSYLEMVSVQWDEALARLKSFVEP